jgi:hypothetical protein
MDRDVIFAVMIAVFGTALIGSVYFGESPSPATLATESDPAQQVYAPNDIRYQMQQQALKEREKAKKRKVVQSSTTSDDSGSSDDGSSEDSSVSDHAPVGEPDLE